MGRRMVVSPGRKYQRLLVAETKAWRYTPALGLGGNHGASGWRCSSNSSCPRDSPRLPVGCSCSAGCLALLPRAGLRDDVVARLEDPSRHHQWASSLLPPPDSSLSPMQPMRCELNYKGTLPGKTNGTCCIVTTPDGTRSLAMDDRETLIVNPRGFFHSYPSSSFDDLPPSYPSGVYEVAWFCCPSEHDRVRDTGPDGWMQMRKSLNCMARPVI